MRGIVITEFNSLLSNAIILFLLSKTWFYLESVYLSFLKIGKLSVTGKSILKELTVRLIWNQLKEIEALMNKEKAWME